MMRHTLMRSSPLLDGFGLALVGTALAALTTALVVLPQRVAQRPGGQGVVAVHLDGAGTLRLWNRPIRAQELVELLNRRASGPAGAQGVLRLIPDPGVPWGVVRQVAAGLENTGLPLELQLP